MNIYKGKINEKKSMIKILKKIVETLIKLNSCTEESIMDDETIKKQYQIIDEIIESKKELKQRIALLNTISVDDVDKITEQLIYLGLDISNTKSDIDEFKEVIGKFIEI